MDSPVNTIGDDAPLYNVPSRELLLYNHEEIKPKIEISFIRTLEIHSPQEFYKNKRKRKAGATMATPIRKIVENEPVLKTGSSPTPKSKKTPKLSAKQRKEMEESKIRAEEDALIERFRPEIEKEEKKERKEKKRFEMESAMNEDNWTFHNAKGFDDAYLRETFQLKKFDRTLKVKQPKTSLEKEKIAERNKTMNIRREETERRRQQTMQDKECFMCGRKRADLLTDDFEGRISEYCSTSCIQTMVSRAEQTIGNPNADVKLISNGTLIHGPKLTDLFLYLMENPHTTPVLPEKSAETPGTSQDNLKGISALSASSSSKETQEKDALLIRTSCAKGMRDALLSRVARPADYETSRKEIKELCEKLEQGLYARYKSDVHTTEYRSWVRQFVKNVKSVVNKGFFARVITGNLAIGLLVSLSPKDLCSPKYSSELATSKIGSLTVPSGSSVIVIPNNSSTPMDAVFTIQDTTSEHGSHMFSIDCRLCNQRTKEETDLILKTRMEQALHKRENLERKQRKMMLKKSHSQTDLNEENSSRPGSKLEYRTTVISCTTPVLGQSSLSIIADTPASPDDDCMGCDSPSPSVCGNISLAEPTRNDRIPAWKGSVAYGSLSVQIELLSVTTSKANCGAITHTFPETFCIADRSRKTVAYNNLRIFGDNFGKQVHCVFQVRQTFVDSAILDFFKMFPDGSVLCASIPRFPDDLCYFFMLKHNEPKPDFLCDEGFLFPECVVDTMYLVVSCSNMGQMTPSPTPSNHVTLLDHDSLLPQRFFESKETVMNPSVFDVESIRIKSVEDVAFALQNIVKPGDVLRITQRFLTDVAEKSKDDLDVVHELCRAKMLKMRQQQKEDKEAALTQSQESPLNHSTEDITQLETSYGVADYDAGNASFAESHEFMRKVKTKISASSRKTSSAGTTKIVRVDLEELDAPRSPSPINGKREGSDVCVSRPLQIKLERDLERKEESVTNPISIPVTARSSPSSLLPEDIQEPVNINTKFNEQRVSFGLAFAPPPLPPPPPFRIIQKGINTDLNEQVLTTKKKSGIIAVEDEDQHRCKTPNTEVFKQEVEESGVLDGDNKRICVVDDAIVPLITFSKDARSDGESSDSDTEQPIPPTRTVISNCVQRAPPVIHHGITFTEDPDDDDRTTSMFLSREIVRQMDPFIQHVSLNNSVLSTANFPPSAPRLIPNSSGIPPSSSNRSGLNQFAHPPPGFPPHGLPIVNGLQSPPVYPSNINGIYAMQHTRVGFVRPPVERPVTPEDHGRAGFVSALFNRPPVERPVTPEDHRRSGIQRVRLNRPPVERPVTPTDSEGSEDEELHYQQCGKVGGMRPAVPLRPGAIASSVRPGASLRNPPQPSHFGIHGPGTSFVQSFVESEMEEETRRREWRTRNKMREKEEREDRKRLRRERIPTPPPLPQTRACNIDPNDPEFGRQLSPLPRQMRANNYDPMNYEEGFQRRRNRGGKRKKRNAPNGRFCRNLPSREFKTFEISGADCGEDSQYTKEEEKRDGDCWQRKSYDFRGDQYGRHHDLGGSF